MNGSFPTGGSGFGAGRGFGGVGGSGGSGGFGAPGGAIWDALDQLRQSFEQRTGGPTRMARGDVRAAVLALLAEEPMHGYQIIHEISERSGGAWKPSAGSVYPTLQLLADEGLISAEEQGGRKTYSLTSAGEDAIAEAGETPPPWEAFASRASSPLTVLPKAGAELASVVAQVARTGTTEQVQAAVTVLEDARRRLYAILAEE